MAAMTRILGAVLYRKGLPKWTSIGITDESVEGATRTLAESGNIGGLVATLLMHMGLA
jgi:hypothetical protein